MIDGVEVLPFKDIPEATLPWVASDQNMVMQLGGPRGKFNTELVGNVDLSVLAEGSLEESQESTASRGAENLLMRFLQAKKPTGMNPKGFTREVYIDFCDWIEAQDQ